MQLLTTVHHVPLVNTCEALGVVLGSLTRLAYVGATLGVCVASRAMLCLWVLWHVGPHRAPRVAGGRGVGFYLFYIFRFELYSVYIIRFVSRAELKGAGTRRYPLAQRVGLNVGASITDVKQECIQLYVQVRLKGTHLKAYG